MNRFGITSEGATPEDNRGSEIGNRGTKKICKLERAAASKSRRGQMTRNERGEDVKQYGVSRNFEQRWFLYILSDMDYVNLGYADRDANADVKNME